MQDIHFKHSPFGQKVPGQPAVKTRKREKKAQSTTDKNDNKRAKGNNNHNDVSDVKKPSKTGTKDSPGNNSPDKASLRYTSTIPQPKRPSTSRYNITLVSRLSGDQNPEQSIGKCYETNIWPDSYNDNNFMTDFKAYFKVRTTGSAINAGTYLESVTPSTVKNFFEFLKTGNFRAVSNDDQCIPTIGSKHFDEFETAKRSFNLNFLSSHAQIPYTDDHARWVKFFEDWTIVPADCVSTETI